LRKLADNNALRFRVLPAASPQTASTNENIDALVSDLSDVIDVEQYHLDFWVLFLKGRNCP